LEEEVFPGGYENLDKDRCFCMAIESEKTGSTLGECYADRLRAAANDLETTYAGQGETLGYILYCLLVAGIGERFDRLMSTPALDGTEYQAHYRAGEAVLQAVQDAARCSAEALWSDVDEEGWRRVVWQAGELADEWLVRVQLATDGAGARERRADGVWGGWRIDGQMDGWGSSGWRMGRWRKNGR
jgi:hypothetical protein